MDQCGCQSRSLDADPDDPRTYLLNIVKKSID